METNEITCQYEVGTGYKDRDVIRIIKSRHQKYHEGRTLDWGNMEIAIKEGNKIVILPKNG